jgi:excisionase family DNA binding protein
VKLPVRHEVLTLVEAAKFLRLCTHTLSKHARDGKVPGQRIGREWRFLRSELEAYLKRPNVSSAA